jgi:hypothetical protein
MSSAPVATFWPGKDIGKKTFYSGGWEKEQF